MGVDYRAYLKSHEWLKLSRRIKKRDGGCLVCRKRLDLNVHHGTYKRLGNELDTDLFTLCNYHHFTLHETYKKRKKTRRQRSFSLLEHTEFYIKKHQTKASKRLAESKEPVVIEERRGSFDSLLLGLSAAKPKVVVKPVFVPFRSRNQEKVERRLKAKAEKIARRHRLSLAKKQVANSSLQELRSQRDEADLAKQNRRPRSPTAFN